MADLSTTIYPAIVKNRQTYESFEASLKLKIINIRQLKATGNYGAQSLKAPFNRIYIVQKGEVILKSPQYEWKLLPGRVYLIPLNANFSCQYVKGLVKTYLHFRLEFFPGQDIFENATECYELASYSQINLKKLVHYFDQDSAIAFVHTKSILMSWLSQLMLTEKIGIDYEQKHYQKYHLVFDSINTNLSANHSIANLAKKMHMSQSNFAKCFRRDTGFSPKAYLNKRLIEEAQHLLISSTQSIASIAFRLKFEDEHYFSRFFKKHTGFSPSNYRNNHHDIK
jgi:AraC-like DNA-binding protein